MTLNFFNTLEATGRRVEDLRRSKRRKLIGMVEVLEPSGKISMRGSVFNISEAGMMIGTTLDYSFPAEFRVRQGGSNTAFAAEVVWHRSGLAGLKLKH